jgi:serine/threonine protein kinase
MNHEVSQSNKVRAGQTDSQANLSTIYFAGETATLHPGLTIPRIANPEVARLLKRRLFFINILYLVGLSIWIIVHAINWSETLGNPFFRYLFFLSIGTFVALLPILGLFLFSRHLSLFRLRVMETVFFSIAICQTIGQTFLPIPDLAFQPELGNTWAIAFTIQWFATITLYGVLIPNSLRRALWATGLMVAIAMTAMMLSWSRYNPPLAVWTSWSFGSLFFLVLAAGFAVFNSARLDEYRQVVEAIREIGPYRLRRKLGSGGMGEVYLAEHRLLKRPCAVKLIRPERARDETVARRFEREVHATTRLTHPSAVQIYDYGQTADGLFYYVMEYLEGLSLDEVVTRSGPLPPGRVIDILIQISGTLRNAHSFGLIHRDIKAGNIMLCRYSGRTDAAKLLDFGLVSDTRIEDESRLTRTGALVGTPAYMSPEQARGDTALTPASDLYSLGVLGYFLLCGELPFKGKNALEYIHFHITQPIIPPSQIASTIPADLERIILKLLEKDPKNRFASAGDVERELHACGQSRDWLERDALEWWDRYEQPPIRS